MFINIAFILFSAIGLTSDTTFPYSFYDDQILLNRFKTMLVNVREQKVSPSEAENEFIEIFKGIKDGYPNALKEEEASILAFPLTKSNIDAVGGKGSGYFVKNFNLFDYSVNGSHPAHDIFIFDPNQDCIDDRKNEYVDIVSVGNGIVMAIEKDWTDSSAFRGGNYVWVYDFERGGLWYYAHHRKVVVDVGQIVKAGDKLGEVGRTGFNARSKRSDTHLHLMYLKINQDFLPEPMDFYPWLVFSKTMQESSNARKKRKFNGNIESLIPNNKLKILSTRFSKAV